MRTPENEVSNFSEHAGFLLIVGKRERGGEMTEKQRSGPSHDPDWLPCNKVSGKGRERYGRAIERKE